QAIELIQRQIEAGEELSPPSYAGRDNGADVSHWRTVTDGVLKRFDPSWAAGFHNVQHYTCGGRVAQIAKLRAFVDLLNLEISHPIPIAPPEPVPATRVPQSIRVTGPNARVNVNSVDNSTNEVTVGI